MSVVINDEVFSLPGRLRAKVKGLHHNQDLALRLEAAVKQKSGVLKVSANLRTGSVLVLYEPEVCSYGELLGLLESKPLPARNDLIAVLQQKEAFPREAENEIRGKKEGAITEPEDLPVKSQVVNVVLPGTVLMSVMIRRILGRATTMTPNLFRIATATTLIATYPVLRSGFQHLAARGKLNHDLIISLATMAVLFMKNGLFGLSMIFLTNLTSLLQTLSLNQALSQPVNLRRGQQHHEMKEVNHYTQIVANIALGASGTSYLTTWQAQNSLGILLAANPTSISTAHLFAAAIATRKAVQGSIYISNKDTLINLGRSRTYILQLKTDFIKENPEEASRFVNVLRSMGIEDIKFLPDIDAGEIGDTLKGVKYCNKEELAASINEDSGEGVVVITSGNQPILDLPNSLVIAVGSDDYPADVYVKGLNQVSQVVRLAGLCTMTARQNERLAFLINMVGVVLGGTGILSAANSGLLPNIGLLCTWLNSHLAFTTGISPNSKAPLI